VVGSYIGKKGGFNGFVWRAGKAVTVDDPKDGFPATPHSTVINGINNGGSVVGFYTSGTNTIGFVGVPSITQP
jgi:hypothetical protein